MDFQGISAVSAKGVTPQAREFYRSLIDFSHLIARYGVNVDPLSESGVQQFGQIPHDAQNLIIKNFNGYASLLQGAAESGIDLRNEKDLLVYVLPRLGLTASADAIDTIEQGHVIEVYTEDHIQIFRNIEFMHYCNYSLLDLLSYTFFELYERSPYVTEKLIEISTQIFTTDVERIEVRESFPTHVLREKFSNPRQEFLFDMKYIWPLYSGPGKRGGLLSMGKIIQAVNVDPNAGEISFI